MNAKFLSLTAELNAFDYFERTVSFLRESHNSDVAWKWVAISLHGALYGFAVSASYGTNDWAVLKGKKNYLIGFDEAMGRCEKGIECRPLALTARELESIDKLKKILRDNFEHFQPGTRLIVLHGITILALDCISVIERLATTGWVSVRLRDQQEHLQNLIAEARTLLTTHPLHHDLQPAVLCAAMLARDGQQRGEFTE